MNAKVDLNGLFLTVKSEIFCKHFLDPCIFTTGFKSFEFLSGIANRVNSFCPCFNGLLCTYLADSWHSYESSI